MSSEGWTQCLIGFLIPVILACLFQLASINMQLGTALDAIQSATEVCLEEENHE